MQALIGHAQSTGPWSILRESLKSFQEKCHHGVERGGTGVRTVFGGRFPDTRRKNITHDRDIQSRAPGPSISGTGCPAAAAATGRTRGAIGCAQARGGAVAQRAGGDSRESGENARTDRLDCGGAGELEASASGFAKTL